MSAGIVVLVEQLKGAVSDVSFEMLGAARALAGQTGAPVWGVLLGSDSVPLASKLGAADKVFVVDNPQLNLAPADVAAATLKTLLDQTGAGLVLIGCTNLSAGIGAILAAKTGLPLVNFCRAVRAEGNALICTSQLFGGKILSDVRLPEGRGVLSIYPGSFPADAGKSDKAPPIEHVTVPGIESHMGRIVFKELIEPAAGDVDITKQDVLVSVGRGIQTQDNIALAEELAQALGGVVSASRPIVDQGWLPMTRQVGKSGMTVKPKLYLALGISGAPEHWEGMKDSSLIIAVNTDPKAPIFDFAHYGATVDCLELIEPLKAAIEKRKAGK